MSSFSACVITVKALNAHHHLALGVLELAHDDETLITPGGLSAASLTRLARSAPERPGVPRAIAEIGIRPNGTLRTGEYSAARNIRFRHHHLAVQAARAPARVEDVGTVAASVMPSFASSRPSPPAGSALLALSLPPPGPLRWRPNHKCVEDDWAFFFTFSKISRRLA